MHPLVVIERQELWPELSKVVKEGLISLGEGNLVKIIDLKHRPMLMQSKIDIAHSPQGQLI